MPELIAHNSRLMAHERLKCSTRTHLTSSELAAAIGALGEGQEFSDGAALTVASHYAGHDASGLLMAELATTGSVVVGQLLDAIAAEYATTAAGDPSQKRHLDLLATWALNHPSRSGGLRLFTVTLTHPDLDGPFVADLCAGSPKAAETRVRVAAMHNYQHADLLVGGSAEVEDRGPYEPGMRARG